MKLTVLGVGNRIMMDEGIGVRVAELLKKDRAWLADQKEVEILLSKADVNASLKLCVKKTEQGRRLFLLDACQMGNEPGCIHHFDLKTILEGTKPPTYLHDSSLLHAMKKSRVPFEGSLVAIEVARVRIGLHPSREILFRMEDLVHQVKMLVQKETQEPAV